MLPAARLQATIEILDAMLGDWAEGKDAPAEHALSHYLRARRYIGSKDRRAISSLFYDMLRLQGQAREACAASNHKFTGRRWMLWWLQERAQAEDIAAFGTSPYAPRSLDVKESAWLERLAAQPAAPSPAARANLPPWLHARFARRFGTETDAELAALQEPAPITLRVNRLKATREEMLVELESEGIAARPTPYSPVGILLADRLRLEDLPAYVAGRVELQDESSQLAALSLGVRPGMRVLDLGTGAGGKALALAAEMQNQGEIVALDIDARRMRDLAPRCDRAGAGIVHPVLHAPDTPLPSAWQGSFDAILVDAPCSGLGTLRRHPDAAWRLTPQTLEMLQRTQHGLLMQARLLLKPKGLLLYAACSLLESENEDVINQTLNDNSTLKLADRPQLWNKVFPDEDPRQVGLTLTPRRHGMDGFFMSLLRRP